MLFFDFQKQDVVGTGIGEFLQESFHLIPPRAAISHRYARFQAFISS